MLLGKSTYAKEDKMSDAYCDATKQEEHNYEKCFACKKLISLSYDDYWIHYVNRRMFYFCKNCIDKSNH